ncbi:MAG TPA: hypothetical protein VMD91_07120 [Candidatus Sulfotelmatobacter sp.]|nr:hypothetical protein [Candidatus Sulfotelmatobacter sp.]
MTLTPPLLWISQHSAAYTITATLVLVVFLIFALWPERTLPLSPVVRERLVVLGIPAVLFAWRWPVFIPTYALNPDEAQMLANALKATVDIVPWHGFDPASSGPLNSDVLTLPALVGAHIDFFSARVVGLLLVAGALIALYFAVRWTYGAALARVAVVPPLLLFAFVRDADFVHYSSEHLPLFLNAVALAAAMYLGLAEGSARKRVAAALVAGLCAGCALFAKLQDVPIAAVLALCAMAAILTAPVRTRTRELVVLAEGIGFPVALILGAVVVSGVWRDFVISYILGATVYVQSPISVGPDFFFHSVAVYAKFLAVSAAVCGASLAVLIVMRRRITLPPAIAPASAVLMVLAALFAVYEPHHPFPHYLLLTVIPLAWLTTNSFALALSAWRTPALREAAAFAFVLAFGIPLAPHMPTTDDPFVQALASEATFPLGPVDIAIEKLIPRGGRMLVWGWMPQYYVDTATLMATRDANAYFQIELLPYRDYFRARMMRELEAAPPPVVVDAVAPGQFGFTDNVTQGIDSFPALSAFVRERYVLANDIGGVRIYRLREGHL